MKNYILILVCLLSGCSFGPITTKPIKYYKLDTIAVKKFPKRNIVLAIDKPQTERGLQSNAMLYSAKDLQVNSYAFNKWTTAPADLLQELLIESFNRSGMFKAVVSNKYVNSAHWVLKIHLLSWNQSFLTSPSSVKVAFIANVYNQKTAKIVASRIFEKIMLCKTNDAYGGVVAINDAMDWLVPKVHSFIGKYAR